MEWLKKDIHKETQSRPILCQEQMNASQRILLSSFECLFIYSIAYVVMWPPAQTV
jgi:hypothetical protein